MSTNPEQDALRERWALEARIPLSGVADGAVWRRARTVATGEDVVLFIVRGEAALEAADAVRRAYLVEDPHLLPVREIVVLDDPRESSDDAATGAASEGPTTVVEYPMPPAPPLAALLAEGPLHPETARAIIGEAATGLEVARRRGVRHQFLDSNRVFVDTRSGAVTILGIGVEAASHPGLDRSREVASFQDTAALVALLYRTLTGRTPQHDAGGTVPRASTLVDTEIPADLDLLCDLVLNESAEDIPETTRGLIEALEPWQSIPVTFEAYPREKAAGAGAAGAGAAGTSAVAAASAGSTAEAEDTRSAPAEDEPAAESPASAQDVDEPTQLLPVADRPGDDAASTSPAAEADEDSDVQPEAEPETGAEASSGDAALAVGAVGAAGAAGAAGALAARSAAEEPSAEDGRPEDASTEEHGSEETSREDAPTAEARTEPSPSAADGPAEDATDPSQEPEAAPEPREDHSAAATTLVKDLHLDEKRSTTAFPGHLDITQPQPRAPQTDTAPGDTEPGDTARSDDDGAGTGAAAATAGAAGAAAGAGLAAASAAGGASDASASTADTAAAGSAASSASSSTLPARTSGTHWPLSPGRSPEGSDGRARQPDPDSGTSTADHALPTPSEAADPTGTEAMASGAAASGAAYADAPGLEDRPTEMMPAADDAAPAPQETGPIVVHGRRTSMLDAPAEERTPAHSRSSLLRDVVGVAVDADDPDTFALGPRDREKRSLQSQWIIVGGVIVVMIALIFAVTAVTSDLRDIISDPLATSAPATTTPPAEEETGENPAEPTPTDTEEPELPAPELTDAEVFSQGSDVPADHIEEQDLMRDGDPATFWSTKHYGSPDYGGLKEGVGVRLSFAEESTLKQVTVTTARNNGGKIELRALEDDGSLGDVLASSELAGDGEVLLETPEPVETDSVALWIPELPPDSNEQGRYRARIAEIEVG